MTWHNRHARARAPDSSRELGNNTDTDIGMNSTALPRGGRRPNRTSAAAISCSITFATRSRSTTERARDPSGGFFHFFKDDGTVYDRTTRHLVSSTRFVFNYAMAYRHFGGRSYLDNARHAFAFLRNAHWDAANEGYDWEIEWRDGAKRTLDGTRHCYGLAFVLLAYAHAAMAGIDEAKPLIDETFAADGAALLGRRRRSLRRRSHARLAVVAYRGQNANMHATEAMLAAYEATGHALYLDRAEQIAGNITLRQARLRNGLVWEHFHADWSVDWHYNESTAPTSSARGVSSPATRPNGPSCC